MSNQLLNATKLLYSLTRLHISTLQVITRLTLETFIFIKTCSYVFDLARSSSG